MSNESDWKNAIPYPYKGHVLSNPQYIKDKAEAFEKNGNGWWWGDGWWNGKHETIMEYNKRLKREKE